MHPTLPTRSSHPCLRQAATVAGLALLLSACGGGNGSATDLGKAAGSTTSAAAPSFSESIALQAKGAALNAQELDEARAEAERLPGNTPLVAGQTAPRAAYDSGWVAKAGLAIPMSVYRFYNTLTGTHFYTISTDERDSVQANLAYMHLEGQAFVATTEPSAGLKPVYRFFNTQTGVHFYTISESERDAIQASLPQFRLEGIAYYGSQVAGLGFMPLYRFFLPSTGTHFYTGNATERQNVQDTLSATHTYEGVAYYVPTGDCAFSNYTTVQTWPNHCYLANNTEQVNFSLPLNADLAVGDTLHISGFDSGGWRISQNAAQHVQTTLPGALPFVWTPRDSNRNWWSVASSENGNKLVAVVNGGQIHTSIDAGLNWTPRESVRSWSSVASSADGNKLVAVDYYGGQIHTSGNAGLTWAPRETNRYWTSVASSADGNKLVAVDGGNKIYTSSDTGETWTPRDATGNWQSVASSADGNQLVAVQTGGPIYTSSDAGLTWTPRETARSWRSVASSADGNQLVAAVYGGRIYTSSDAGLTWTPRETDRNWLSVSSSADGSKLVATGPNNQIYTTQPSTAPGTAGYLQGAVGSYIELKYLGNGVFEVVSSSGTVSAAMEP